MTKPKNCRETEEALRQGAVDSRALTPGAALAAFNGVFMEGIEVVFIVLTMGAASKQLLPAALGAGAAAVLVVVLGLVARQPLTRIPENALKLAVGALVSAFGTLWAGEGLGMHGRAATGRRSCSRWATSAVAALGCCPGPHQFGGRRGHESSAEHCRGTDRSVCG